MSTDSNSLIGYWALDSAPESAYEVGVTHIRFADESLLQEGNENEWRRYVLSFEYWLEGESIATICPPNPRIEQTPFSIAGGEKLTLFYANQEMTWARCDRKKFFESKNIWDPGILFDRQTDYMSLLELKPKAYQIERSLMLDIDPQFLVNTEALWKCWRYGNASFASFHLADFEQILARGVLIDEVDNEDRTLLSYLAEDGYAAAVQKAVQYGAVVNHYDLYEHTALDYATWANRSETMEILKSFAGVHGRGFSKI
ncbi:MAG: hypothetical protein ABIO91_06685 [Pyrinomonadaceae bacterium]